MNTMRKVIIYEKTENTPIMGFVSYADSHPLSGHRCENDLCKNSIIRLAHERGVPYSPSKDYIDLKEMPKSNWDYVRAEKKVGKNVRLFALRDGATLQFDGSKWESTNLMYSFHLNEKNIKCEGSDKDVVEYINNVFRSDIVSKVISL